MPVSQFTVGASRTINLGNFESLRVEASLTVDVPAGDDFTLYTDRAQEDLRALLSQTYLNMTKKNGKHDPTRPYP